MASRDFGAIHSKLFEVLRRREAELGERITYDDIYQATGTHPATLSAMVKDDLSRVDLNVLARLCWFLQVGVGDLLEYVPPPDRDDE